MNPAAALAIAIMGPTASGKSAAAMELARRVPAEIVSVDSAQVYRGMDLGTAKPTAAERAAVAHHLIDVVEPTHSYSAARFRQEAIACVADIAARERLPLLVGGTMLYFKALREGLSDLPAADPALRCEIEAQAAARGWPALHAELARADPQAAARLKPSDASRIQRALEILRLTGGTLAQAYARRTPQPLPFRLVQFALLPSERAVLHARIASRFEAMLAAGLVDELRALRARHALAPELPSMRCVGYRQAWEFLDGHISAEQLRAQGVHATRQLAKRQLTWLRATAADASFDCCAPDLPRRLAEAALAVLLPR